jgi:hypothetical protein
MFIIKKTLKAVISAIQEIYWRQLLAVTTDDLSKA